MSQSKIKSHLSWLGVAAIVAGAMAASSVQAPAPAFAQQVQTTLCRGAAGQQVSASANGQPQGWAANALNTLCNGAEESRDPGQCFSHVMTSNSVNYGGGTAWNPNNALRLCAGATNQQRRVACFQGKVTQGVGWSAAIDQCIAEERTVNAQVSPGAGQRITPNAPRVTTPIAPAAPAASGPREPTLEEVQNARLEAANRAVALHCVGPLRVEVQQRDPNDARSPTHISVFFRAATSGTSIAPGQCWRAGGWGNGALMHPNGQGVIYHETRLGNCALLRSLRFENGALADIQLVDSYPAGVMLEMGARAGQHIIETRYGGSITEAGADPRRFNAERPEYASQPSHCRNS
jgi:hypothetical protein